MQKLHNTKIENNRTILDIENRFESVGEDGKLISQETINMVEHTVQDQYQVLSKNDFGKTPQRINIGFFNKKTDFRVSGKDSIIAFNKETAEIVSPSIEEIKNHPYRYLMIYKYPFFDNIWNDEIEIKLEDIPNDFHKIILDENFGEYLGKLLKKLTRMVQVDGVTVNDLGVLDIDFRRRKVLETIIQVQGTNKFSINKKILLNSNPSFLMGILEGFFDTENTKYFNIPETINVYTISTIFNLLSASYSIRLNRENEVKKGIFTARFKLPNSLNEFPNNLNNDIFRKHKYLFLPNKVGEFDNFKIKFLKDSRNYIKNNTPEITQKYIENGFTEMMYLVNNGLIELIPTWDLVFNKIPEEEAKENMMYDLIMENDKAHNFQLNNLPMLHNSDGDIMGVIGLFTKQACADARKHFSAENKLKFKDPVSSNVMNWGIKTDAQVGWYNATK